MQGGLVVGAGILLGNITGFFRVAVTAWLLGTRAGADSLATAMGPMDVLNSAIVNTMLFAFVPMLLLRTDGERAALFARAGRIFASIAAGITVILAVFAPQMLAVLGPGLAAPERAQAILLLRWMAPSTLLATAASIYSALLYTDRRFVVPGLYQMCLNGATMAGALLLRRSMGINGFAIGYTTGSALHLLLTWFASRDLRRRAQMEPRRETHIPIAEVLHGPGMFLLYASLIAGNLVVTRIFATQAGSGMAAAFDYSMRCSSVVLAYLVYPVAATLVPEIARLRGTNEIRKAYGLIDNSVVIMAIAAVASVAIGIALRTPIIALIFQRGSFTAESTRLVSAVFLGFAPSLIGWALLDLIARCFFAMNRPRLPVIAAFVPILLNLTAMSILRADGRLMNPMALGAGSSIGLLAGFGVLFTMVHLRREHTAPEAALARAGSGT